MATKTISLDLEAYNRLRRVRRKNESFSQVIKRVVQPPFDYNAWLKSIAENPMSEEMAAIYDDIIERRRDPINCEPRNGLP
jgi:predicted CopG family antitoxin